MNATTKTTLTITLNQNEVSLLHAILICNIPDDEYKNMDKDKQDIRNDLVDELENFMRNG